jgi:hypothetical protein
MNKIFYLLILLFISSFFPNIAFTQSCNSLTATAIGYESRCAATGSIQVTATGGTGLYKYKAVGPVTTNFTTSNLLSGLPAGTYAIVVNDVSTNCEFTLPGVMITGNYQDARFDLTKVDVSCENGNNASISVVNQQFGRAPFTYSIVAPSPMGVGTTNSTGIFNNLIAGDYGIRMTDSCGGVQTRRVVVNNYNWWIDSYSFTKLSCDSATGYIKVTDSKGNVSTVDGMPGFIFGIVRSAGDTIWSSNPNFTFFLANQRDFKIVSKDSCGNIKIASSILNFTPIVGATAVTQIDCNSFSTTITNITNFFNPSFCLYNSSNVLVSCNAIGVFNNIPYGSYCITAHDACTDTIITRCFSQAPPPLSVGQVAISAKTCIDFTATVTDQDGLTNPNYCLYDKTDALVSCNTSGIFTNLSYGQYCIKIKDGCRDTTITRCFTVVRPRPLISSIIDPLYITCTNFGVSVGGDSLNNPEYCLFDAGGIKLVCNNTGIFDSLPFGNYCVSIYDPCVDTTINRCFMVLPSIVTNDVAVAITNNGCSIFTATASSSLSNPEYCLYNSANVLLTCNTTGIFDNLPYGSYCIKSRNSCPDTTFTNCFTVNKPVPSVNANVNYSSLTCTTFNVRINGQTNLTNPQFCLYDNNNVQLSCNTTGIFTNLAYGSYCIRIVNSCYDTTIVRCFTKNQTPLSLSVFADLSCSYGFGYFDIKATGATAPINIKIVRPNGNILLNRNYTTTSVSIDSIPGILPAQVYKIIVSDNCGRIDSINSSITASYFTHIASVTNKCPSATASAGSGDIQVAAATNMGTIQVRITRRNGVSYSPTLTPNTTAGGIYTFKDLSPGVYVLRYRENYCSVNIFDTITIKNYTYPNLSKSSAYQCDVNGFSVGAVASGGVAPYSYEIIGSTPAIPAISTPAQGSPIFNINNGASYSLIRLRAIDACGNGTLNDGSILPLANTSLTATLNCFAGPTTLAVDSIYNSTYLWYWKATTTSTDSTLVGTGSNSYYIPDLSPLDTGIYVCKIIVNGGCITRVNSITINGECNSLLPTVLKEFSGNFNANNIDLNWVTTQENKLHHFTIEKLLNNRFTAIGTRNAVGNSTLEHSYSFVDTKPFDGANIYRVKLEHADGKFIYSNVINLKKAASNWTAVFPNPVQDKINVQIQSNKAVKANLVLYDAQGKMVFTSINKLNQGVNSISITATNMASGLYNLNIQLPTGEVITQRIIKQ